MASIMKLFSIVFRRRPAMGRIESLPQSLRRDLGLPADPDPPKIIRNWEQFL
ncbi:hypothetical protein [Kiloniella antarctica]|uniref:DUF1127 domain-containing protein n=1 Tax=Kiloniella antarctica TaxID=1550907 RepID=A0ABW5BJZ9_9PROT